VSEAKLKRQERRGKKRELKEQLKRLGMRHSRSFTLPNRKCSLKTIEEEHEAIQAATEEKLKVIYQLLPGLLKKLSLIPDPRHPNKIKHQITVMMLYGIFMFMFSISSRRQANKGLTGPQLLENLRSLFPYLEDMPHQDTLCRLLQEMDADQIEDSYLDLLRHLIRRKKFRHLLRKNRYLVAIDGTQKCVMKECWDERYLRRRIQGKEGEREYYAYVLEAVLVFANGMVLPLLSEFLENDVELETVEDREKWKQDCELKAFHRLAKRLKGEFPKLPFTLLLDGLYANGPVMAACRRYNWEFMIVLKDKSLPSVWEEVKALKRLDAKGEHQLKRKWQGRRQTFWWANGVEYEYGTGRRKWLTVHVVVCEESFEEIDAKTGGVVTKASRHAWISSNPIDQNNIHARCNLIGRKRWLQENNILKEKHQGYSYEHIFSHNWNAMKGYHYLMHIARMINEMAVHSVSLIEHVKEVGIQSFINKFYIAMVYMKLDTKRLRRLTEVPGQLRLVQEENWKTSRVVA
jgi:hypothetical protein